MSTAQENAPAITEGEFKAMPPEEQRVAIARDVLAQIEARRCVPRIGQWLATTRGTIDYSRSVHIERAALLSPEAPTCYACAVGSVFLSAVRLGNECDIEVGGRVSTRLSLDGTLSRYFSDRSVAAMEFAFEGGDGCETERGLRAHGFEISEIEALKRFTRRHRSARARLTAICQNIIQNGDFVAAPAVTADAGGAS